MQEMVIARHPMARAVDGGKMFSFQRVQFNCDVTAEELEGWRNSAVDSLASTLAAVVKFPV